MAIAFPKPKFAYAYDLATELTALRNWKTHRAIPAKDPARLLLATWNVANLGLQQRRDTDYQLIAEIVGWFDLVAIQEVNDNLAGLRAIQQQLPPAYRVLFSDAAGNDERLAFVYDSTRVTLLEKVGEIAIPPSDLPFIKLEGIAAEFKGFDRNPYLAAFQAGHFRFILVNVHLFFGDDAAAASIDRRCLETFAVARWCDIRRRSKNSYTRDIIALGDFNLPKADSLNPVYRALTRRGLKLPAHSTQIGSSIASDNHYDQVAFHPAETAGDFTGNAGVFDYDGAIFADLWAGRPAKDHADFKAYIKYYISDHRPLWTEFNCG